MVVIAGKFNEDKALSLRRQLLWGSLKETGDAGWSKPTPRNRRRMASITSSLRAAWAQSGQPCPSFTTFRPAPHEDMPAAGSPRRHGPRMRSHGMATLSMRLVPTKKGDAGPDFRRRPNHDPGLFEAMVAVEKGVDPQRKSAPIMVDVLENTVVNAITDQVEPATLNEGWQPRSFDNETPTDSNRVGGAEAGSNWAAMGDWRAALGRSMTARAKLATADVVQKWPRALPPAAAIARPAFTSPPSAQGLTYPRRRPDVGKLVSDLRGGHTWSTAGEVRPDGGQHR